MKALFFIPVFNQIDEFPRVLEEMRAAALEDVDYLLVNNGSSDGSEGLVHGSGLPFLDVPRNLGIGHSYMLALDWALARPYAFFGSMASNGKMLPAEIPRLLEPLRRGRADYVTGSRFLPGGASPHLPGFRRRSIPMVNLFVQGLTGARMSDATCGFRGFRLDLVRAARFDWRQRWLDTYGLEYYLYAKVVLDGRIRWSEVPITMRYPARGVRYSKIRPFVGWYEMLKPWVAALLDGKGFARLARRTS